MYIQKVSKKPSTKPVKAEDEVIVDDIPAEDDVAAVEVDPEATDLLFEAEDVAELVAEVTGQEVEVSVDNDAVVFTIGDDEFTVEPEGDEEILEASKKVLKGKKAVRASKSVPARKAANRRPVRRA